MVINNVHLTKNEASIRLSAYVKFEGNKSERMYFETELKNETYVSSDYSPFLASVLLPCMRTGEDIIVEGSVSNTLLENAEKIMDLVEKWNIGLNKIKILANKTNIENKTNIANSKIACFFSAGVDSFYTYLKHRNSTSKITELILIHGFDIPLHNEDLFVQTKNAVAKIAKEENANAINVETNAGEIVEKHLIWDFAHGGALAGVALFLGQGLKKVYVSGGLKGDELFPYGTHPDLDKLWSTENTEIIHDGTEYNRLGKVLNSISKSELALSNLRVCPQNIKGQYNCGQCYKCLQTMIELVCAGVLDKAKTFPKLDLDAVRNMYYDYALKYNLQGEANLAILNKQNREPELQKAIEYSLENSKKLSIRRTIFKMLASFDQNYNSRRFYRFIFQMNKNQDRKAIFKILKKSGVLK